MLRWRLLLGAILIAMIVLLAWLDGRGRTPGLFLFPLGVVCCALASQELRALLRARHLFPRPWLVYGGSLLIFTAGAAPLIWWPNPLGTLGWPTAAAGIVFVLAFIDEVIRYGEENPVLERLALGLFCVAYVGGLLSFVMQLRLLGPGYIQSRGDAEDLGGWGIAALGSLIAVVKLGDTGAYTVGRLFGKRKLCPRLSPGKTIEGAVGGLLFACLGSWATLGWLLPPGGRPVELGRTVVFGLIVGAAGMFGDLAESLIKRDVGRKDSSTWMPGFGGVLDVLDAILFAAPVAWWCWWAGLVRG